MPDRPLADLAACRAAIDEVDRQLMALVAERARLGRRAAELKRAEGRPILDPRQEEEVVRRAMDRAAELSLPTEEVRAMFGHVIALSRKVQESGA